jgi:hypothetical protein
MKKNCNYERDICEDLATDYFDKVNPRYVLWAKLHGNTPEYQLEVDRERWPGGSMCGYSLWIDKKASEFAKKNNEPRECSVLLHQDDFTAYLEDCVTKDVVIVSIDDDSITNIPGKSLIAKAIATDTGRPLLRFDTKKQQQEP